MGVLATLLLLATLCARPAEAQQLAVKRTMPRIAWAGCAQESAPAPVPAARQQQAAALADSATQAAILGNTAAAAGLLANAARLNPASQDIAYRYARALEEAGRREDALAGYCRFMALAPDADDAAEARGRISALSPRGGVLAEVAQEFNAGIAHYDAGRLPEAEAAFGRAFDAAPTWADAVYNRGVVRLAQGLHDAGAADLRRYLELSPGASDLGRIVDALARYGRVEAPPYNPSLVFVSGVLLPGLGHFTTGRPGIGMLVMGLAAAGVATGFLVEQTDVVCLAPPVNGVCPPDQVLREEVSRPYLVPGIAAAAAVGFFGAIDAVRGARRRNAEAATGIRLGHTSLHPPALTVSPTGARLALVRLRF